MIILIMIMTEIDDDDDEEGDGNDEVMPRLDLTRIHLNRID